MGLRFDRRTLSKAKPTNLIRLAKYIEIPIDDCICDKCMHQLVEVIVRKLDIEEKWPSRLSEPKKQLLCKECGFNHPGGTCLDS